MPRKIGSKDKTQRKRSLGSKIGRAIVIGTSAIGAGVIGTGLGFVGTSLSYRKVSKLKPFNSDKIVERMNKIHHYANARGGHNRATYKAIDKLNRLDSIKARNRGRYLYGGAALTGTAIGLGSGYLAYRQTKKSE